MSTYLFAFVVGKFEFEEVMSESGIGVRVYTPEGRLSEGKIALDVGKRSLEYYEKFYGIPYPLKKLDLISVHGMHVRAMENWGCITFADYVLLNDEESTPGALI